MQSYSQIPLYQYKDFFYRPNDFPLVQPLKTVKELMAENVATGQHTANTYTGLSRFTQRGNSVMVL